MGEANWIQLFCNLLSYGWIQVLYSSRDLHEQPLSCYLVVFRDSLGNGKNKNKGNYFRQLLKVVIWAIFSSCFACTWRFRLTIWGFFLLDWALSCSFCRTSHTHAVRKVWIREIAFQDFISIITVWIRYSHALLKALHDASKCCDLV